MQSFEFSLTYEVLESAAWLTGLLGYTGFAFTLMLPTRLRFLERLMRGLPHVYYVHHVMGFAAFEFILMHPIFLAWGRSIGNPLAGAQILLPSAHGVLLTGWVALLVLMAAMVATFLGRLKYESWRTIHAFTGIAFVVAFLHVVMASSGGIQIYYAVVGVPAVASFLYWEVFHRIWTFGKRYRVVEATSLAPGIAQVTAEPLADPLRFVAGQFVYLSIATSIRSLLREKLAHKSRVWPDCPKVPTVSWRPTRTGSHLCGKPKSKVSGRGRLSSCRQNRSFGFQGPAFCHVLTYTFLLVKACRPRTSSPSFRCHFSPGA